MIDWENELKHYIKKKFEKLMGIELPLENIKTIQLDLDFDYELLDMEELANIYVFAIMKEDFEEAKEIKKELKSRDCEVKLDINEKDKTGVLYVHYKPELELESITIHLKILPDGMMIDFDKNNF